ncbi:MAG TPA: hypothetical protein VD902_07280, partial [Symbiobacteriaceae bacterium]|nr:hypothetical protein [Symbiobacteriaceae bacterium]
MNLSGRWRSGTWRKRLARSGLRGGLALLLVALLPISTAFSATAPKAPSLPGKSPGKGVAHASSRWPTARDLNPDNKIDPRVKDAFTTSAKPVTYLVKLRAEADVAAVANSARKASSQPALRELNARSAVIRALRQTADESQQGILSQLKALQKQGRVTRMESFWISNMVLVTSNRETMQLLAKRSDVAKIMPDAEIKLINADAKPGKVEAAAGDPSTQSVEWGVQRVGAP